MSESKLPIERMVEDAQFAIEESLGFGCSGEHALDLANHVLALVEEVKRLRAELAKAHEKIEDDRRWYAERNDRQAERDHRAG